MMNQPMKKMENDKSWIGVDLDGTLAEYRGDRNTIGKPIEPMVERVKKWIKQGKKVKIFTARANDPEENGKIQNWLGKSGLPAMDITCRKDHNMDELWDDKAVSVAHNTGKVLTKGRRTKKPWYDMNEKEVQDAIDSGDYEEEK